MKPSNETRSVTSSDNLDTVSFGISAKDTAHIMGLLRDGLYTDKILAVLREYGANAWDAHRMVGKDDLPLQIHVPTYDEPILRIRDFGPGLSHEDVQTVYSQYGASTKRETNAAVGQFGVGSKSGFAYSDTFTVISWHGGMKRTYVAVMDESEKGQISLLDETACDPSDTGVEIVIAVREEDIRDFQSKAKSLFRHFQPRPEINLDLPAEPVDRTVLKNGTITTQGYYGSEWIAIMGCIPYRVTLTQLDLTKISKCLPKLSGSLFFEIGEVRMSASREELKYDTATKATLVQRFNDLVDEYVVHALEELERPDVTAWDKRLKVQVLSDMELPLPEEYKELAFTHAKIEYTPGTINILHGDNNHCTRITVRERTRLLIDDTGKKLEGYHLNGDDYVVRAAGGQTPDEVRTLLEDALAAAGLAGATIELLSSRYWNAPYVKPKKVVNPKHRAKMFELSAPKGRFAKPYSDFWNQVDRVPEDEDVYVLVTSFEGYSGFFHDYNEDFQIAEYFGFEMPKVYGYKTTEKKPVDETKIKGMEYRKWREKMIQDLLTPDNLAAIQEYFWHSPSEYYHWPTTDQRNNLVAKLGPDHLISTLLERQAKAERTNDLLGRLAERAGISRKMSDGAQAYDKIQKQYPLLSGNDFQNLWYEDYYRRNTGVMDHWVDYVRLVDERLARVIPADGILSMVA